jgi:hypothetical protein
MIKQGNRKLYTAEEKQNYLHLFEEQAKETGIEPDFGQFAKDWDIPVHQFRLWRQVSESGLELKDSKPLPTQKAKAQRGDNGKEASQPNNQSHHVDQLTRSYWAQQLLRARLNGRDKVESLTEAFVKATGFHPNTIVRWTREYVETPRGKKFEKGLQPKPPKVKRMPGRPAHSRYTNPETGVPETKLHPEYWNKLITLIGALNQDLTALVRQMNTQAKRLDELLELWR